MVSLGERTQKAGETRLAGVAGDSNCLPRSLERGKRLQAQAKHHCYDMNDMIDIYRRIILDFVSLSNLSSSLFLIFPGDAIRK